MSPYGRKVVFLIARSGEVDRVSGHGHTRKSRFAEKELSFDVRKK